MTASPSDPVLYEVRGDAAWITLNTPENHNALSMQLCRGLADSVARANADDAARMIVLTGVGRSFCSGADLKSRGGGAAPEERAAGRPPFSQAILGLWNSPKPVIGRIQGGAYGGGVGLIAACDFAICADRLKFAFTEVRLGLAPSIISVFVLRKLSLPDASRTFLTGERFSAEEGVRMGLIHRAVPEAELDGAVAEQIDALRQCGPRALQEVKKLLRTVPQLTIEQGLDWAEAKNKELFNGEEGREGMAAFAEKRKPSWAP